MPKLSELKPLAFGRAARVVFGLAVLAFALSVGIAGSNVIGPLGLGFLGLSFLVGGLIGNPGCELSALPNLLLPKEKRVHFL